MYKIYIFLFLGFVSSLSFAQALREAKKDDIASGTIVLETDIELRLRSNACDRTGSLVVFYPPYVKTKIGEIRCGEKVLEKFQVEKQ